MGNIKYNFSYTQHNTHREKWEDFYPSERWAFETISSMLGGFGRVLDIGCGTGGLGHVLSNRFHLDEYVGIDINPQAIQHAKKISARSFVPMTFYCEDILRASFNDKDFNNAISLGCVDWNIETLAMIERCWSVLCRGGRFIVSVRLTAKRGI